MAVVRLVFVEFGQYLMMILIESAGEVVGMNYAAAAAAAKGVVEAVGGAELVSRTRVRSSHLAARSVAIWLPMATNSVKEELAA